MNSDRNNFQLCQLCENAPASCKAHIIPKQFYKRLRGAEKNILELRVGKEVEKGFTQNGIWEQGILCPNCDNKLGDFDRYAYEIFPEKIQNNQIHDLGCKVKVYELGLIDTDRFKKFLVALVWRASCAKHRLFNGMDIGPYKDRFKGILTGKDTSWLSFVDCVCFHFKPPKYGKYLLGPYHKKFDGINCVEFQLYPWKVLIKLDRQPFGETFKLLGLKFGFPTFAPMLNRHSRGEWHLLLDLQRKLKRRAGMH